MRLARKVGWFKEAGGSFRGGASKRSVPEGAKAIATAEAVANIPIVANAMRRFVRPPCSTFRSICLHSPTA